MDPELASPKIPSCRVFEQAPCTKVADFAIYKCKLTNWGAAWLESEYPDVSRMISGDGSFCYFNRTGKAEFSVMLTLAVPPGKEDVNPTDFTVTLKPPAGAPSNSYELWVELEGIPNTLDAELWGRRYYLWRRIVRPGS